jgi:hypothetical protein
MAFRASTPPAKQSPQTSPLKQRPIDPAFTRPVDQTFTATPNAFAQAPVSHIDTAANYSKKFDDQSHVSIDFSQQQQHQQQTLMMEQEPLLGSDSRTLKLSKESISILKI